MKKLLIIIILLFVGSIQAQLITWTAIKSTIHDSTALKLTASKNLSDLVNTTTARASLGVYSTGSVDTFLGAKLDTTLATALLRSQWNLAYTRSGLFAADTTNWNTAYTDRMKWDGGSTGLVAATGRTSLGLGTIAVKDTSYYYRSTNPSNFIALTNISSTVTGIPYNNTTGVISLLANYFIPTDSMATLWSGKQTYYANLSSIGALANSSGWLKNNGSGTFSYSTPSRTDLGFGTMTMVDSTLYNAKIASIYAPLNNASFTGAHTIPTPFTLGATSVTATGAELNTLAGSGFTSGYLPYYNGTKLANSGVYYNGMNVGIGTTAPSGKLSVVGGTNITGTFNYISEFKSVNGSSGKGVWFGYDTTTAVSYIGNTVNGGAPTDLGFVTWNGSNWGERMRLTNAGNVGIGYTSDPTSGNILFANGSGYFNGRGTFTSYVTSTQFRLSALNTAPASAIDTGTLGEIRIVNGYIYVCVATNTWQRAAITTW